MKKKKLLILCVVVLICVVGLFFVVGDRNIENTMAKNNENLSSVETVNVVENLEVSDSVESSTEVPSVDTSEVQETVDESNIETITTTSISTEVEQTTQQSSEQPTTEPESTVENSISDLPEIPNYSAEFYSQDNTGKYVFTEKFYTMVLNHPYFAGATVEEVSNYYNENDFYLVDLQFGELDAFNVCLNNAYDREGQPYLDEVVQSTPSTSTETQSQTQTGQNTAPSQSTTNSSENTTEEEPEYIEWKPSENLGDGGNLVGNTVLR